MRPDAPGHPRRPAPRRAALSACISRTSDGRPTSPFVPANAPTMTEEAHGMDDAVRAAKNEVVLRDLNERLKAYPPSQGQRFSEWVCECADMTCSKSVELSVEEYEMIRADPRRFLRCAGA